MRNKNKINGIGWVERAAERMPSVREQIVTAQTYARAAAMLDKLESEHGYGTKGSPRPTAKTLRKARKALEQRAR